MQQGHLCNCAAYSAGNAAGSSRLHPTPVDLSARSSPCGQLQNSARCLCIIGEIHLNAADLRAARPLCSKCNLRWQPLAGIKKNAHEDKQLMHRNICLGPVANVKTRSTRTLSQLQPIKGGKKGLSRCCLYICFHTKKLRKDSSSIMK